MNTFYYHHVFEINYPFFDKEGYEGVKEFFQLIYKRMDEEIFFKQKKK